VENSGIDSSLIFHAIGHSEEAKEMMRDFCIGKLSKEPPNPQQKAKKKKSNALALIIFFILAVGIAFYLRIKVFNCF
jgi:hypothetical protein